VIAYAAVPALVVSAGTILYGEQTAVVEGVTLGVDNVVWVVSAATTVALVPSSCCCRTSCGSSLSPSGRWRSDR
jgi:hypothetical protein